MTDHRVTMLLLPPCERLTPERATAWLTGDAHGLLRLVMAGFHAPRASLRASQNLASDLGRMTEACGWALRGASVRVEREHEPGPPGDFERDAEDLARILAYAEGDRGGPCAIVLLAEELGTRRAMMRGTG